MLPMGLGDYLAPRSDAEQPYIASRLIPLAPSLLVLTTRTALVSSVVFTLAALLVFGYINGRFTGAGLVRSALQTALTGGLAAAVAYGLGKAMS